MHNVYDDFELKPQHFHATPVYFRGSNSHIYIGSAIPYRKFIYVWSNLTECCIIGIAMSWLLWRTGKSTGLLSPKLVYTVTITSVIYPKGIQFCAAII